MELALPGNLFTVIIEKLSCFIDGQAVNDGQHSLNAFGNSQSCICTAHVSFHPARVHNDAGITLRREFHTDNLVDLVQGRFTGAVGVEPAS